MAREARLGAGETLDPRSRRRGRIVAAIATVFVGGVIYLGNMWWSVEASAYDRYIYKPLTATADVTPDASLRLTLRDPGWIGSRRLDDFVPDHGHPMHLFVVSPALDRFWHLHPREITTAQFEHRLPDLPAGQYELFADLVHATGVSETVIATVETAGAAGRATVRRRQRVGRGRDARSEVDRIVWVRDNSALVAKRLTLFTFRVEDGERTAGAGSRALHGNARSRGVLAPRSARVCARASVGFSADGGDEHRDALWHRTRAARDAVARRRCRSRTDFQSRARTGFSCR